MKAQFEVDTLLRQVEIGCAEDEHGVQQAVTITLRATLDGTVMFAGDTRTPPFDYCALIDAVDAALASRARFILQETLVVAIAARVLADPLVERIEIALDKTERYQGCRAIGVRAAFERADLAALAARYPEDPVLNAAHHDR
ncbi:MAG: dihydroneopterin aldolase [Rubrivivax sp.]